MHACTHAFSYTYIYMNKNKSLKEKKSRKTCEVATLGSISSGSSRYWQKPLRAY